nr:cyclic nucleotide-gated ion channel 1 [Quercus suber]
MGETGLFSIAQAMIMMKGMMGRCLNHETTLDHLDKSLREAEDRLQDALANEVGTSPSLGATIYASRFAANALRTLRQNGAHITRVPQRLLPLLPQKPAEPNFDAENH